MRRALSKTLGGGALLATLALLAFELLSPEAETAALFSQEARLLVEGAEEAKTPADRLSRSLALPSRTPSGLSCDEARIVVKQAREHLAAPPEPLDPRVLAEATADWLDPHGLWSAAPDALLLKLLERRGRELIAELEADHGACSVADEGGTVLAAFMAHLRPIFDESALAAEVTSRDEAFRLASEAVFEERSIDRPASDFARELGFRLGATAHAFGPSMRGYVDEARARLLPELPPSAWSKVLLAAAVRAYVPMIDPHGGWAPLDEETSLYELDLEGAPPPKLWGRMQRTALGARIDADPLPELALDDVVLEVMAIPTAGLSVEQLEQLAIVEDAEEGPPREVVVLRAGEVVPITLPIRPSQEASPALGSEPLSVESIPYGEGEVLVVTVSDVPDDLGELVAQALEGARRSRSPRALLLDLRGNGGGSTDGASETLSLFLPGATLFPMRRRDGIIEVERANEPVESRQWRGPVASLVDADTASAAEMIAGGLASYRRGLVVGSRTYGKGCAQEYLDDDARAGVLRLTTLVYSLPDGTPVQRVGLMPTLQLGNHGSDERESLLPHALPAWRGPDVRDPSKIAEVPWPLHGGKVGPCLDEEVCRALRALGSPRPAMVRGMGARR